MKRSKIGRWLALATVAGLAQGFQQAERLVSQPVRRAVVVGIDRYRAAADQPPIVARPGRLQPKGRTGQRDWSDLEGAVNDAESIKAMLAGRFGFSANQIVTLENEQATADAILDAVQKHLIDDARPGDISIFYFAGHGSQIRNTRTRERSGFDQTIVPADAPRGIPDIRDKELARLFRGGVSKGIVLTTIFDSCHSGSIARGYWNRGARTRNIEPDNGYVEDPPDLDASGRPIPDPESAGMLVLSAAQDYQAALETDSEDGVHGLFTWSLLKVLQTAPPNERTDRLLHRVRAVMQAEGTLQEPVLAGAERGSRSLLGVKPDNANVLVAAVDRVWNNQVHLQAGAGIGLNEGCELRKLGAPEKAAVPRIRITKVLGLSSSEALILESGAGIEQGDLFQVVKWTAPDRAALRVLIPQIPWTLDQLSRYAAELFPLRARVHWVVDPTVDTPTHVMTWSGSAWNLEENGARHAPVNLGERPSRARVAAALPRNARFLLLLPAPGDLAAKIQLGSASPNNAIGLETSPARAHYTLYGHYDGGRVAYAWVLPNLTEAALAERFVSHQKSGSEPPAMALPIRSDWLTSPDDLTGAALKLGRIHSWLQLDAPVDTSRFPYHLALREREGAASLIAGGTVREGQKFELVLTADPERLAALSSGALVPRRVYVFCIDRNGASTLLFPPDGQGDVENRFPVAQQGVPPAIIPLPSRFEISKPFGIDTYFLLTSEEPLPSPEVLKFDAVRTAGPMRAGLDPLARLISRTFEGRRGATPAVPLNWSVERMVLRSVSKGELHAAGVR